MGSSLSFPMVQLPKDCTAIVTGANTGIGYDTAKWIAMMGAHVIIACRGEDKALQAIEKMQEEYKEHKQNGLQGLTESEKLSIEYMHLDLSSLKSTQNFVETFVNSGRKLHILVCNAGIAMYNLQLTEDGHESQFQVNYLSHFLLSVKLLPVMQKSGEDCRIVFVSSDAYKVTKDFSLNHEELNHNYSMIKHYGRSKLYQVMQMYSMNRRILKSNVSVTCVHPGFVGTDLGRNMPWIMQAPMLLANKLGMLRSSLDGAKTSINAAVNPSYKGMRDVYFSNCKPALVNEHAKNKEHQEDLWNHSIDLLKDFLSPSDLEVLNKTA